jgi:hypothetical protein
MEIKINLVEVATELADKDLIVRYIGELTQYKFPNGLVIDEDETRYTKEAQVYFDQRYDYWWDYFFNINIDNQVKTLNLK